LDRAVAYYEPQCIQMSFSSLEMPFSFCLSLLPSFLPSFLPSCSDLSCSLALHVPRPRPISSIEQRIEFESQYWSSECALATTASKVLSDVVERETRAGHCREIETGEFSVHRPAARGIHGIRISETASRKRLAWPTTG